MTPPPISEEKVSVMSEIPPKHDYLVFQLNRNLPPVFQKKPTQFTV
jgi:hypothetical protein